MYLTLKGGEEDDEDEDEWPEESEEESSTSDSDDEKYQDNPAARFLKKYFLFLTTIKFLFVSSSLSKHQLVLLQFIGPVQTNPMKRCSRTRRIARSANA